MIEIWMAVGLLALALHPFTSYPLSLLLLRRFRPPTTLEPCQAPRRISICMCAYNEIGVIRQKVRNLLALETSGQDDLEILIYVDGATDGTAEALTPFGDQITVLRNPQRHGKTYGMRRLVEIARGDILVFTDANTLIDQRAIKQLTRHFTSAHTGCVCGHLRYRNDIGSTTSDVNSRYWRLEESIKRLESLFGCVMGADGSLFAVRRGLYPYIPDDIIDDFFVSMSVLSAGYDVVRAEDVLCYELAAVDRREEFQRKVRIACQAFNVHRLLWPRIRRLPLLQRYCYVSHKLLRWLTAWLVLAALLCGAAGIARLFGLAGIAAVIGAAALAGISYAAHLTSVRKAYDIWLAFYATGLGVLRSLRGQRFQTWSPAQSVRAMPTNCATQLEDNRSTDNEALGTALR